MGSSTLDYDLNFLILLIYFFYICFNLKLNNLKTVIPIFFDYNNLFGKETETNKQVNYFGSTTKSNNDRSDSMNQNNAKYKASMNNRSVQIQRNKSSK